MKCRHVTLYLDACRAGELDVPRREAVEAHLRACPACRRRAQQADALAGALASLPTPPVPGGFAQRTMMAARLRKASAARPAETLWWNPADLWRTLSMPGRAAAAAVLAVGLGLGALMGLRTSSLPWRPPSRAEALRYDGDKTGYRLDVFDEAPDGSLARALLTLTDSLRYEEN